MSFSLIVDIVLGVILLICALVGAGKGLYNSIVSIVSAIVSLVGAAILSRVLAGPCSGIINNYLGDTIASVLTRGAGTLLEAVVQILLFLPLFLILSFVIKAIMGTMDPLFDLPIVGTLDKLLGGILGLVECLLVFWMFMYIVLFFGIEIPESITSGSMILSFLVKTNPTALFTLLLGSAEGVLESI